MYLITYFCPTLVRYTAFLSRYYLSNKPFDPSVLTPETEMYMLLNILLILEGILFQLSLVVSKVFVASETVSYPDMGAVESSRTWSRCPFIKDSRGPFVFIRKISEDFFKQ